MGRFGVESEFVVGAAVVHAGVVAVAGGLEYKR